MNTHILICDNCIGRSFTARITRCSTYSCISGFYHAEHDVNRLCVIASYIHIIPVSGMSTATMSDLSEMFCHPQVALTSIWHSYCRVVVNFNLDTAKKLRLRKYHEILPFAFYICLQKCRILFNIIQIKLKLYPLVYRI